MMVKSKDEAVSPVIAVILMVAITVVLAAVVYVWVSEFSGGQNAPAGTVSLSSMGPESAAFSRSYVVTGASPGMTYGDLVMTVDGAELAFDGASSASDGEWNALRGGAVLGGSEAIRAGDTIRMDSAVETSGKALRVIHSEANSVILVLMMT